MTRTAYTGARIFDGEAWWDRHALVVADGKIEGIIAADSPTDAQRQPMGGGILAPGFIDLQVNGGGGVLFNNAPSVDAIRTICAAHAQFGTTALLPTLITDTVPVNIAAMAAGKAAAEQGVRGADGTDGIDRRIVVEQHAAAAINLQVDEAGNEQAAIEGHPFGIGRNRIRTGNAGDMAEFDQQRRVVVPVVPLENAGAGNGQQVAHTVSVTFLRAGGTSGLRPRWRDSVSTKP